MDRLLEVENLSISFGGIAAVDSVSLHAGKGEITAVIGPNGAGKTTLFNMVTGVYRPSQGRIRFAGNDVTGHPLHALAASGMSRTFQNLRIFEEMTALENVMVGFHLHRKVGLVPGLLGLPVVHRERRDLREQAHALLKRVHLGDVAGRIATTLSYGQMKRLEIARSLATDPEMLLLDEPAAGCNAVETAEIDELIRQLRQEGLCIVVVDHDMQMIMSMSDRVFVLDGGRKIAEGTPAEVARDPKVIASYLGSDAEVDPGVTGYA